MDQIKALFDGIVAQITAILESYKKTIEDLINTIKGYIPELPIGKEDE